MLGVTLIIEVRITMFRIRRFLGLLIAAACAVLIGFAILRWGVYFEQPEIPFQKAVTVRFDQVPTDPPPEAAPDKLPKWTATEAELELLGAPFRTALFEIRPPATFRHSHWDERTLTKTWFGDERDDETSPAFSVTIKQLQPAGEKAPLADLLRVLTDSMRRYYTEFEEQQPEYGIIDGLPFIRSGWSGVFAGPASERPLAGRTQKGIVYATKMGDQWIRITCRDVIPEDAKPDTEEWLRQGGIAAMTFRKAPEAAPDKLPKWTATDAELESLGEPYRTPFFEIRPPATAHYSHYDDTGRTHVWTGDVGEDETYPEFTVTVVPLTPSDSKASLRDFLREFTDSMRENYAEIDVNRAEFGTIAGLPFLRSGWSGVAGAESKRLAGRTRKGIVYGAKMGDH